MDIDGGDDYFKCPQSMYQMDRTYNKILMHFWQFRTFSQNVNWPNELQSYKSLAEKFIAQSYDLLLKSIYIVIRNVFAWTMASNAHIF
jgi:hypothetical protein